MKTDDFGYLFEISNVDRCYTPEVMQYVVEPTKNKGDRGVKMISQWKYVHFEARKYLQPSKWETFMFYNENLIAFINNLAEKIK